MKKKTQASLGTTAVADSPRPTVHAVTSLPWTVKAERGPTGDLRRLDICAKNRVIAGVLLRYHDGQTDVEHEAYARLIAAAPEFFELLCESQISITGDWMARRDALLARIEDGQ